jgi:hypothetical protein
MRKEKGFAPQSRLTNQELKAVTFRMVAHLRAKISEHKRRDQELMAQKGRNEITGQQMDILGWVALSGAATEFVEQIRAEALNIEGELRRRLSPEALQHVVRMAPDINVSMHRLMTPMPREFSFLFADGLAEEIDQMAKLLPD